VACLGSTVLRTCFRVMKPAGKLLLTTNLVGQMHEFSEVSRAVLHELGRVDRLTAHVCQTPAHRRGFRAPGDGHGCASRGSSFLRHAFIRLGFLPAWQSVVLPDAVERTCAVLERQRNTVAAERGELALTIPIACVEAQKPGAGEVR
jgi:arsenite methyltransferase